MQTRNGSTKGEEREQEGQSLNSKKEWKKSRKTSYNIYIYRLLKASHPEFAISKRSISVINSFLNDVFEQAASEASRLARHAQKKTLSTREVQTAIQLLLPGELAKHALAAGRATFAKYRNL